MIQLYGHCWRGREDCESIDCVHDTPEGLTEDNLESLKFKPNSFVCSGLIAEDDRTVAQDCYRLCFVSNAHGEGNKIDEMSDNDTNDLTSLAVVVNRALLLDSLTKSNSDVNYVPDDKLEAKRI